jgi:hypothetical protein
MRHPDSDFLYGDRMDAWRAEGRLARLITAVPRGARTPAGLTPTGCRDARGLRHPLRLVGIDLEKRALGLRPDGRARPVAVEGPDPRSRAPHSTLVLRDEAVARSCAEADA